MNLPPGYTEAQVLQVIDRCTAILAPQFAFGPYEVEDLQQEAVLLTIDLLAKNTFDPQRGPLANYIYSHLRRRLLNLRRARARRADAPCRACHSGQPCGGDGRVCERYRKWDAHQAKKANLAIGVPDPEVRFERAASQPTVEQEVEYRELLQLLRERLSPASQAAMATLLDGDTVESRVRVRLRAEVRAVLCVAEGEPLREVYSGLVQALRKRMAG